MKFRRQTLPFLVSTVIHALILFGLWKVVQSNPLKDLPFTLETVLLDEDRPVEEVVQELDQQIESATSLNFIAGSVSKVVGGSNAPLAKTEKIEIKEEFDHPTIKLPAFTQALPGADTLSLELGEAEVTGEVGDVVEGYGAALDRLSQELIRLMRSEKLLVVWMFDESKSMKDDQVEIKGRLQRVYEELRLVESDRLAAGERKKLKDVLLTAITSFGAGQHKQTEQPTSDPVELMKAIDKIPVEETGAENLCASIIEVVKEYRPMAARSKRKLVIVVVSDESGDDGQYVEEALDQARSAKAPIYVLGRESVFGSLYAHVRWKQPISGHLFYLPVRRGPETPFAEQLQFDGFRRRRDSQMSGFGPYEQVRLCRNTGGIFFQLPGEQEDLNDLDNRENAMLNLREYQPDISARRLYQQHRDESPFRKAIWEAIVMLNPYNPAAQGLELPDPEETRERFNTDPQDYGPKVRQRLTQVRAILTAIQKARVGLEKVRDQRDAEPSLRWRANYDLMAAQLLWYQVRLFEYGIGLDQFIRKDVPKALSKNPKHNRWLIRESPSELVMPDALQQKFLGVTPDELQAAYDQAVARLEEVKKLHPGSPWARRAEWELNRKSGLQFSTYYQAPPGKPSKVKRPTPPPPPKL